MKSLRRVTPRQITFAADTTATIPSDRGSEQINGKRHG